ncbi:hypothetical protein [Roseovarius atlanticus]|uniref:hypothetical protein n=1 Tax=Roseovarius atlanticus TaxID=1641875 RepID=UPI001C985529|nr:hypothetical protein [Roseovarius atlanticus]MBY5989383.1 hypothetical protein [Roseovarius atlanticus]MBY6124775.1 hypothetical protein [Roseovarius atlanticus]MBY6149270.1 hypothetical protein [Roseovarius atlanticus]
MPQTEGTEDDAGPHPAEGSSETSIVVRILLFLSVLLAAWGGAVVLWGVPGLYLPALALVPVIWLFLLIISRA